MPLKNIQLCTIDPSNRADGKFDVTVHSDDGNQLAIFACSSEENALRLRSAIRENADFLRRAADYRARPQSAVQPVDASGRQRWAGDEILGQFVANISALNNGGAQQVAEFLARQPVAARAQFIERCLNVASSVAETLKA